MPDARRMSRAPWVVAAVAGVVLVVLLVVFFVPLKHARDSAVPGQLTATEQRAVGAASTEAVNLLSYRRAHFNSDYARSVAGSTGALRSDIESKKSAYLQTLTQGKFDTSANVVNQALVGSQGNGFVVLITVNAYKSTAPTTPVPYHLEITVQLSKGKYLASNFKSIEVS